MFWLTCNRNVSVVRSLICELPRCWGLNHLYHILNVSSHHSDVYRIFLETTHNLRDYKQVVVDFPVNKK